MADTVAHPCSSTNAAQKASHGPILDHLPQHSWFTCYCHSLTLTPPGATQLGCTAQSKSFAVHCSPLHCITAVDCGKRWRISGSCENNVRDSTPTLLVNYISLLIVVWVDNIHWIHFDCKHKGNLKQGYPYLNLIHSKHLSSICSQNVCFGTLII